MAINLTEGRLTFSFSDNCKAAAYDKWAFVRNQYQGVCGGTKAVDFLCIDRGVLWLIEVKDYRLPRTPKPSNLSMLFACKVRDSIAGLVAAQCNANDPNEQQFAQNALRARQVRAVLHIEQPHKVSRLFPKAVDPGDLKSKIKKLLKAFDAHPEVVDSNSLRANMNWKVTELQQGLSRTEEN